MGKCGFLFDVKMQNLKLDLRMIVRGMIAALCSSASMRRKYPLIPNGGTLAADIEAMHSLL